VATFCKADIPTVAAEEGLTGYWSVADPVGHVGSKHSEVLTCPSLRCAAKADVH
jgi:hypothetical protein